MAKAIGIMRRDRLSALRAPSISPTGSRTRALSVAMLSVDVKNNISYVIISPACDNVNMLFKQFHKNV